MTKKTIIWFRNDLRLSDNAALSLASKQNNAVIFIYIYNPKEQIGAAAKWFLHNALTALAADLKKYYGAKLLVKMGDEAEILTALIAKYQITKILWNRLYEPQAIIRDSKLKAQFKKQAIEVQSFNSSLLFEPNFIKNNAGEFFKVFSPFWRKCLSVIDSVNMPFTRPDKVNLVKLVEDDQSSVTDLPLLPTKPNWAKNWPNLYKISEEDVHAKAQDFIVNKVINYKNARDFPGQDATSLMSPFLHFGLISPKLLYFKLIPYLADHKGAVHYLSELGWREFSYYLLYHFPALETKNFNAKFDGFSWENDQEKLQKWQKGQTGFPIIDAGMRQLWQTGWMHNRVRMIVASFLIKNLLIDWRYGLAWFADCLIDADKAANAASWQWVAGSGADAAPYFRIFNPVTQSLKFDPEGVYIRKWVPEIAHLTNAQIHQPENIAGYFPPMVDLAKTRNIALENYKKL